MSIELGKGQTHETVGERRERDAKLFPSVGRRAASSVPVDGGQVDAGGSPDFTCVLSCCLKRVRSWRVPPNWSTADWFDEVKAVSTAAAWQAACDYDPARGVPFYAFVHARVLARVLTRYRQEWAYALRAVSEDVVGRMSPPGVNAVKSLVAGPDPAVAYESLYEAVATLSESSRSLVGELFWEEHTETAVAARLGISHQAVSKRKQAILRDLRGRLGQSGD